MADKKHAQTSRKRVADKQINKDHPEHNDNSSEQETGTFKKACEEVMATREIVKVQNQQPSTAPSSNPFSAIIFNPSYSTVQASMAVSEPPPSDVINGSGKESDAKNKSSAVTEAPSEEPKEDNSKTSGIEGKTEDGDAIEKAVDEAGGEDKTSNDDDEKKDEAESGTKDGSSEQNDADNKC